MAPTRYSLKTLALEPRTRLMRRKYRDLEPIGRAMLEAHSYRRAMLDFMGAVGAKPDLLHDVEIDAGSVVFDLGAYVGEWAAPIAERYDPTIYSFEPASRARVEFEQRLRQVEKVRLFPFGLGGSDHTATLGLEGPGSSVHKTDAAFGYEEIEVRDIVAVLDELGLDRVDLLKVNIEGSEYDLFDRLIETGWLPRIRLVSIQFHEWIPGAHRRRREIRRALRQTHEQVWDYPWVWEYWRRIEP